MITSATSAKRPLLAVAAVVALASCSADARDERTAPTPSEPERFEVVATRVDQVTLLVSPRSQDALEAIVSGPVELNDDGCVTVGGRLMIAPAGSTLSEDGTTVLLAGYDPVRLGSTATLGGGEEEVPVADADAVVRACLPAGDDIAAYALVAPGDL